MKNFTCSCDKPVDQATRGVESTNVVRSDVVKAWRQVWQYLAFDLSRAGLRTCTVMDRMVKEGWSRNLEALHCALDYVAYPSLTESPYNQTPQALEAQRLLQALPELNRREKRLSVWFQD